jgi:hypothetical protein
MDHAKTRAPFVTWFTCGFESIDHAISEDDIAIGIAAGSGRYTALCGATVCVASMTCPPGRRCPSCEAVVLGVEHNPPSPDTGFLSGILNQLRGHGRHRNNSTNFPAGGGLFRRRK